MLVALPLLSACESPQSKAATASANAERLLAAGDMRGARQAIGEALKATPDDPVLLAKLGQIEAARGAFPQSYMAFQRVLDIEPNNIEALEVAAQFAATAGDRVQAQRYLDTLALLQPESIRGQVARITLSVADKKFPQALAEVNKLLETAPDLDEAVTLKARVLAGMRKPGAAADLIESRLGAVRSPASMLRQLLELYQMSGNQKGIEETYIRLYRLRPKDATYQYQYIRAMLRRGDDAAARTAIDQLRKTHWRSASVRAGIVHALAEFGGPNPALEEIRSTAPGSSPAVLAAFGEYLVDTGQPAVARTLLAPVVTGDPDARTINAHVALAEADFALRAKDRARETVQTALAFDPTNARALRLRTEIALADRSLEEALGYARQLVAAYPADEGARLLLIKVHTARKEPLLVESTYREAVDDFPRSPTMMHAFTDYLIARDDLEGAADAARDFTKANPLSRSGWTRQAELCERTGNTLCASAARAKLSADAATRGKSVEGA